MKVINLFKHVLDFYFVLGGDFKCCLLSSLFGEIIQVDEILTSIFFRLGWFNHQLL